VIPALRWVSLWRLRSQVSSLGAASCLARSRYFALQPSL
jgi:hypothetical protein